MLRGVRQRWRFLMTAVVSVRFRMWSRINLLFLTLHCLLLLVANWVARSSRIILVMAWVAGLRLDLLSLLPGCRPYTVRIIFTSIQRFPLLVALHNLRLRLILLCLLMSVRLQLLLASHWLILLVHKVDVIFFLVVERGAWFWLILLVILRSFSFLIRLLLFLRASRTAHHSFEVLEGNHHHSNIVKWLSHQTVFQDAFNP